MLSGGYRAVGGHREFLGAVNGKLLDAGLQQQRLDSVIPTNPENPDRASYGWGIAKFGKLYGHTGEVPKLAMNLPLLKNFSVVGVFAGAWEDREPEAAREAKEKIMALIAAGKLRPHVGLVVPMTEIGRAMAAIGERSATGRVVVTIR